jgi:hypothetical protein
MRKKAQLEIMQTAFVLMIVFMILVIVFFIGMSRYNSGLKAKNEDNIVMNDINRYQIMNFLPELKCSFGGVYIYECYDKQKLESFKIQVVNNQLYYRDIFGYLKLSIGTYGSSGALTEEIIFENPRENYVNKMFISHPIIIYDNEKKQADEGVMSLEIYD